MKDTLKTVAIAGLALLGGAAAARGQETPAPVLQPGSPCPAVVQVSWDVTSIEGAVNVRWQVRADAEGGPALAAGTWQGASGTEEIDLRPFGSVLNGRPFYVRVRPRAAGGGNIGPWSPAGVYDRSDPAPSITATRSADDWFLVDLTWQLSSGIEACGSAVAYEIAQDQFSVLDGPQPDAHEAGVLPAASGSTSIDVSGGSGVYYIRGVALGSGNPPGDIGLRGYGTAVPLGYGRLTVSGHDLAGTTCGGGETLPAVGAVVTVSGESYDGPVETTATLGDIAVHTFELPPGEYTVSAARERCATLQPTTVTVSLGETESWHFYLADCPPPEADLAVAIEAPATPPVSGQAFDLQVTVTLDGVVGPSAERRVEVLRETLVTARGPVRGRPTVERVVGRTTVEAMCPGEAREVSITENRSETGNWVYRARLSGRDSDAGNDSAIALVTVEEAPPPLPDLALSVSQSHETLPPGETITYTVSVGNPGQADVSDAFVRNTVSKFLDFVSVSGSSGFSCAAGDTNLLGLQVLCQGGDVPVGATATIEIAASLVTSAGAGNSLIFISWADPDEEIEESDESNNRRVLSATTGSTGSPDLVLHEVPDPLWDAMEYAAERGFENSTAKLKGNNCQITGSATSGTIIFWAHGGPYDLNTQCEFRLLQGPALAAPWTIAEADVFEIHGEYTWMEGSICSVSTWAGGVLVRVTHPGALVPTLTGTGGTQCGLESLTLQGPAGADWQDAFD